MHNAARLAALVPSPTPDTWHPITSPDVRAAAVLFPSRGTPRVAVPGIQKTVDQHGHELRWRKGFNVYRLTRDGADLVHLRFEDYDDAPAAWRSAVETVPSPTA